MGRIYFSILVFLSLLFWLPTIMFTIEFKDKYLRLPSNYKLYKQTFQSGTIHKSLAILIIICGAYLQYSYSILGYLTILFGVFLLGKTRTIHVDFTNWEVYDGIGIFEFSLGKAISITEINEIRINKLLNRYFLIVKLNNQDFYMYNTTNLSDIQVKAREVKDILSEYL